MEAWAGLGLMNLRPQERHRTTLNTPGRPIRRSCPLNNNSCWLEPHRLQHMYSSSTSAGAIVLRSEQRSVSTVPFFNGGSPLPSVALFLGGPSPPR